MYPDIRAATVDGNSAMAIFGEEWSEKSFIPHIQCRGKEIIDITGHSSTASAGSALLDHI